MLFSLTNVLAPFQNFINNVLASFLDRFVTVYLDDILIYLYIIAQHSLHVRCVLDKVRRADLHVKAEKCQFYQTEVT